MVTHLVALKVTSTTKLFCCHKGALDLQLMIFFHLKKSNVSFSRYQDFCVFMKSTDFKMHCYIMENALMFISFEF